MNLSLLKIKIEIKISIHLWFPFWPCKINETEKQTGRQTSRYVKIYYINKVNPKYKFFLFTFLSKYKIVRAISREGISFCFYLKVSKKKGSSVILKKCFKCGTYLIFFKGTYILFLTHRRMRMLPNTHKRTPLYALTLSFLKCLKTILKLLGFD